MAACLVSVHAEPKDDVAAAIKKLGEAENYSWKSTVSMAGSDRAMTTSGKATGDGWMHLEIPGRDDSTMEAVMKGEKGAIKRQDGWQTLDEADASAESGGDGQRRRGFAGGMLRRYKAPVALAEEILAITEGLAESEGALAGTLSADGVKEMMTWRRRGGEDANAPSNTSGNVKFWMKDGVLSKIEYRMKGSVSFNGETRDIERTTVIEISDVGATDVAIPDDVKAKLAS